MSARAAKNIPMLLRQTTIPRTQLVISKFVPHQNLQLCNARCISSSFSYLTHSTYSQRHSYSSGTRKSGIRPPSLRTPKTVLSQSQRPTQENTQIKTESQIQEASGQELVLSPPALVVTREYEWGNIILGFEQANKYTIRAAPGGDVVGFIAEDNSLGKTVTRNLLRTHRPFRATVLDKNGNELFHMRRPMYLVSTSIFVEAPDGELLGEVHMNWHLWRRRYDLYVEKKQFAVVDSGFLALDFDMRDIEGKKIASVNRDFTGFAREIFTDSGQYVIRMDPSFGLASDGNLIMHSTTVDTAGEDYSAFQMGLRERAVMLATAISVDFDYFSRHSRHHMGPGMMFMPPIGGGGGGSDANPEPGVDVPAGAAGPTAAAGADVFSDSAQQGSDTATANPYDQTSGAFSNDPYTDSSGNVNPSSTDGGEWASFEEPDHGFQDPFPDDSAWSESNDTWGSDDIGGGDEEGGSRSILKFIFDLFSDND